MGRLQGVALRDKGALEDSGYKAWSDERLTEQIQSKSIDPFILSLYQNSSVMTIVGHSLNGSQTPVCPVYVSAKVQQLKTS